MLRSLCSCLLCCLVLLLPQQGGAAPSLSAQVVLLLDQQGGAYADSLRHGLTQAEQKLGIKTKVLVVPDADTQEEAFKKASRGEYALILVATPAFHELLLNNAGNFRRQKYACIDEAVKAPNIASVLFADAEAVYLAGAAATLFSQSVNLKGKPSELGFVGGADNDASRYALSAFLAGAKLVDAEKRVLTAFAGAHAGTAEARSAALALHQRGAGIILHWLDEAGKGVSMAAQEKGFYALGRASAPKQKNTLTANPVVLFSVRKDASSVVLELIEKALGENFPGGQVLERGLEDGSVGLSGMNNPALSEDVRRRVKELEYEIKRKTIKLGVPKKKSLCDCL